MLEDLSEDSKVVNMSVPFITVTVLMEDPQSESHDSKDLSTGQSSMSQNLNTPVSSTPTTPVSSTNSTPTKSFKPGE